jgi:hypothetical protein
MALQDSETRDALCSTLAGGGCRRWAAAIGRVRVRKWVLVVESEGRARISRGYGRDGASSNQVAEEREGIAGVQ